MIHKITVKFVCETETLFCIYSDFIKNMIIPENAELVFHNGNTYRVMQREFEYESLQGECTITVKLIKMSK